jgi:outer membrane protein TolC
MVWATCVAASMAQAAEPTYPIDLATALRLAGAQNLDVQLARNAVDLARANYTSALTSFMPSLAPTASYLRHSGVAQAVNGPVVEASKQSTTAGLGLNLQLQVGEAAFAALQSRRLVAAADAAADVEVQASTLAAARRYFELVRAGAQVDVVNQALAVSQDYQQQLADAVITGIAFKGDLLRVETQTQRLQLDLAKARQQQALASASLAQALNLDPLVHLIPAETEPVPLALADLNATAESLVKGALEHRPEIAQSRALVAAAEEGRRGAVYGPLVPTLSAQASTARLSGGPLGFDRLAGNADDVGVGLTWKFGQGGLFDRGRIRSSDARLRAAQLSDERQREAVSREVADSYTRVTSLFEQVRLARLSVTSAAETLRLTRERKQLGVGTVLEDVLAQQELVRARSDLVASVTELNQEQYALLRAIGSGPR